MKTAKFHFNEHNFFYTRTKRKSYTNVTDFVRTFNRLIFITNFEIQPFLFGAKVGECLKNGSEVMPSGDSKIL